MESSEIGRNFHSNMIFHCSMKPYDRMKEVEFQLAHALRAQLERVPALDINFLEVEGERRMSTNGSLREIDILVGVTLYGCSTTLICEVKEPGHPRQVRNAINQLHGYMAINRTLAIPLVGASWLSLESRRLCEHAGVGWIDLAGNCRIAFEGVYIERETAERPKAAARYLRALFSPKAGQVLRMLLRDPSRSWKVTDLSDASDVSIGHVSNVRKALIDREWATVDDEGLRLTAPNALLDAWRDDYEPVRGKRTSWYTTLHGRELEQVLRNTLNAASLDGHAMLGGLSAAHWLAPYVRGNITTLYADNQAIPAVVKALNLRIAKSGANVEIVEPDDDAILKERVEHPGAPPVSSPVQTYLDLWHLNDRGREAADHLREKLLTWN